MKKSLLPALTLLVCAAMAVLAADKPLYKDAAAPPRARAADLLSRMTVDEKFSQLEQYAEYDAKSAKDYLAMAQKGMIGSVLNTVDPKLIDNLQRTAVESSRLGIPILFAFDIIHGFRTIFPIPLGEAAQWDPVSAENAAAIAAREGAAAGLKWTFAPMVDIARDPRWGRIAEGSGEDPYLGSALAASRVKGFQGADFSRPEKLMACAKHWVGYGAAEGGRDYNTTDISEFSLNNIYYPPFRAAVDAGVATFMSAFNALNGVPASGNRHAITEVLRDAWNFKGFVVSDYGSISEMLPHEYAADEEDAAVKGLNAGVDMEMFSTLYRSKGPGAIAKGRVSTATLDASVLRILEMKFKAGLFERPYADPALSAEALLTPDNRRAALDSAEKSLVLLKNDAKTLPLDPSIGSVAVVGPLADSGLDMIGSWPGDGKAADAVTLLKGVKDAVSPKTRIIYYKGCPVEGGEDQAITAAVAGAAKADVIIAALGETAAMSGEAASRASLDIPGRQLELLAKLKATGKPVVVVLFNGRPLELNWLDANLPAVVEAWFPGTEGGHAVANALFGKVNFGGKLPVSFPRSLGQVPLYYNHMATGRPVTPGKDEKYTSRYMDVPNTPLYPFGYGLSYTSFALSGLKITPEKITAAGEVSVGVDVKNTGGRQGDEVVQIYIRAASGGGAVRPVRELKGFRRVTLAPGEIRHLEFKLGPSELGYHYPEGFTVEPGVFKVYAGNSSEGGLEGRFEVAAK
jgi:beta-glucosidase